jgi:hypothetical protein
MVNGGTDEQERDPRSSVSGKTAIDVDAQLSFVGAFDASRSPHQKDVRLDPGRSCPPTKTLVKFLSDGGPWLARSQQRA